MAAPVEPPRIAFLSYSTALYDARTQRMARSALRAGYRVIVYARWEAGLALEEDHPDGYRIVRVASDWRMAVPGLRGRGRRHVAARLGRAARPATAPASAVPSAATTPSGERASSPWRGAVRRLGRTARGLLRRVRSAAWRALPHRWFNLVLQFPLRPMAWAIALEPVAQPADVWHGMWAGSLPALARLRARFGGRTVYDSRDVFLHARDFERLGRLPRAAFLALERRWAQAADAVVTVNEAYAGILARELRIPRPPVVMNCPERWDPPSPPPDRIREALGVDPATAVVLYQGILTTERGIEQSMEAILEVPGAVLALMGFGRLQAALERRVTEAPSAGRVFVLPAVPPGELLAWTASADVMVMAIQPTTLNHRYTTPQKLFEALAAGVPVVASDLPGMADIVTATGAGVVCDATSPGSIAAAVRGILAAPPADRAALRARALRAAHEQYNWEAQAETLLNLYAELGGLPVR